MRVRQMAELAATCRSDDEKVEGCEVAPREIPRRRGRRIGIGHRRAQVRGGDRDGSRRHIRRCFDEIGQDDNRLEEEGIRRWGWLMCMPGVQYHRGVKRWGEKVTATNGTRIRINVLRINDLRSTLTSIRFIDVYINNTEYASETQGL